MNAQIWTDSVRIPKPAAGTIRHFEKFPSAFIEPRSVDIWLPETYDTTIRATPHKRYPVLYMHDGQMLFDSTITWNKQEWGVDETASRLMREGIIRECIVVGVWNNGNLRRAEYFPQKPFERLPPEMRDSLLRSAFGGTVQSDAYLKFLTQELKPFVDSAFFTLKDAQNTFIAGSSMGGLISMYALCEYPSVFGAAACLSTHWVGKTDWNDGVMPKAFNSYMNAHLPQPIASGIRHKIYFDYGTATTDSLYKPHQQMVDRTMRKKGYTRKQWITKEFAGEDHSERAWARRLDVPLVFLLGHKK